MSILSAVGRYIDAWNVRDANAIVQSFHSDGTYEDPVTAKPIAGSAIAEYAQSLWSAFPDLHFTMGNVMGGDDEFLAFQWQMTGTNKGAFQGLPPTNRTICTEGADFIRVEGDKIRSVRGYFDSRAVPLQLGLDIIVQPASVGPFAFGTSVAVSSGRTVTPGAFSVTQLIVRSAAESDENRALGREIAAEMLGMKGFIGVVTAAIGDRRVTISAWEDAESPRQVMRGGTHATAMRAFWAHLSDGGYTSVWVPARVNAVWVRCPTCQHMVDRKKQQGVCSCGATLPPPRAYW